MVASPQFPVSGDGARAINQPAAVNGHIMLTEATPEKLWKICSYIPTTKRSVKSRKKQTGHGRERHTSFDTEK